MTSKVVVVISGGLDSSTLLHHAHAEYPNAELYGISFDYGQRHKKELDFAKKQCADLDATHKVVDMSFIGKLFADAGSESSLIADEEVPEGHYGEASMAKTVVPNRNMIMLAIAGGYAVSLGAERLATGVHAGDHFIYPDCRPEFFSALSRALYKGNEGFISEDFQLWTPFIFKSKNDIAARAFELNVDIANTWSCYNGRDIHCGKCGTCVERQEAIASTGKADPTAYEDDSFWREALNRETV
jgi:7-cyano-7-deazaguanine synthase